MQQEKDTINVGTDSKPLVTYAGDRALFDTLRDDLIQGLPTESVEWRRSYGRPPKMVYVDTHFSEFNSDELQDDSSLSLIGKPFLHTFWTDCTDLELYKTKTKNDISTWLAQLKGKNTRDWLIVLVEGSDSKKGGKAKLLPRTSVLDKIRNDFCRKQSDRCITAMKSEGSNNESWLGLLQRLRQFLLQSYNRQLSRFEENMRAQRERRNEAGWNFCDYFLLQEELAFVFEMFGIYDEALVQYDELDALFTQFVINSNLGDTPEWLMTFSGPCLLWEGLSLLSEVGDEKRQLIREGRATLLDLRNYLFSRQCSLLLLMCRPWEIAQRFLTFMHSCINERQILEVEMPAGAMACWVFLSSLEILYTCEKFKESNHVEAYSIFTASLWAYARSKLQELGTLCGLMPDATATSEQLHHVVVLLAGMGNDRSFGNTNSPFAKLGEALSSSESFQKQYLELSELAVGTLKHIGRIRSARSIGRDLAEFYMKLGEPQKAASFLLDALKTFQEERWPALVAQTLIQLTECYAAVNDRNKLITARLLTASNQRLPKEERDKHFERVKLKMDELEESEEKLLLHMGEIFDVDNIKLLSESPIITIDTISRVQITIRSNLPEKLFCEAIIIAVARNEETRTTSTVVRNDSKRNQTHVPVYTGKRLFTDRLNLQEKLMYLEDKSLANAYVATATPSLPRNAVSRQESNRPLPFEGEVVKLEFNQSFKTLDVTLEPGVNQVFLTGKSESYGSFVLSQLIIQTGRVELIRPQMDQPLTYDIVYEAPSVSVRPKLDGTETANRELVAGVPVEMELKVESGSLVIADGTKIQMKAAQGLFLKLEEEEVTSVDCSLSGLSPFESWSRQIRVVADFSPRKDNSTVYTKMLITCPWVDEPIAINLHFVPPFMTLHRLSTINTRKVVQVSVHGLNSEEFELGNANLHIQNCKQVVLNPLNPPGQNVTVSVNRTMSYIWEMVSNLIDCPSLEMEFTVDYICHRFANPDSKTRQYKYSFKMSDYKTLFTIHSKVEPRGSEFCRAGNMCNMNIKIVRNTPSGWSSLMYEVLADQTTWAVCGRTAGVVNMESSVQYNVLLDVMPLTSGYLPLPTVRLSKYIPAEQPSIAGVKDSPKKVEPHSPAGGFSRLECFCRGQIYNCSDGLQVYVLPAPSTTSLTTEPIAVQ